MFTVYRLELGVSLQPIIQQNIRMLQQNRFLISVLVLLLLISLANPLLSCVCVRARSYYGHSTLCTTGRRRAIFFSCYFPKPIKLYGRRLLESRVSAHGFCLHHLLYSLLYCRRSGWRMAHTTLAIDGALLQLFGGISCNARNANKKNTCRPTFIYGWA